MQLTITYFFFKLKYSIKKYFIIVFWKGKLQELFLGEEIDPPRHPIYKKLFFLEKNMI